MKHAGKSVPLGLGLGIAVSIGITLLAAVILAVLVDSQTMHPESVSTGIYIALVLASAAGTLTALAAVKQQLLLVSVLLGAVYLGMLLSMTALFFGGEYKGQGTAAVTVFGTCLAISLLQLRTGHRRKPRALRYRK